MQLRMLIPTLKSQKTDTAYVVFVKEQKIYKSMLIWCLYTTKLRYNIKFRTYTNIRVVCKLKVKSKNEFIISAHLCKSRDGKWPAGKFKASFYITKNKKNIFATQIVLE